MTDRSASARKGWETRRRGGQPIRAGEESADSGVVLIPQTNEQPAESVDGVKFGTSVVAAGFVVDLRADHIVALMSGVLLAHHHDAIRDGRRPEGGAQRPLSEGRKNDPGRESQNRGYKTGRLAEGLRRTKITGSTASAKARILPPTDRNVFLAEEAKRGVHYLSAEGEAGEAAAAAAHGAVSDLASGRKVNVDRGGDSG